MQMRKIIRTLLGLRDRKAIINRFKIQFLSNWKQFTSISHFKSRVPGKSESCCNQQCFLIPGLSSLELNMDMSSTVTHEACETWLCLCPPKETEGQKICCRRDKSKIAGHMSLYAMATSVFTAMPIIKTPKTCTFLYSLESSFRYIILFKALQYVGQIL